MRKKIAVEQHDPIKHLLMIIFKNDDFVIGVRLNPHLNRSEFVRLSVSMIFEDHKA